METTLVSLLITTLLVTTATSADVSSDYRLPQIITPSQYDISLYVDPTAEGFNGSVKIYFSNANATANVTEFYVNADPSLLTISSVTVNDNINCSVAMDNVTDLAHVTCDTYFTATSNYAVIVFQSIYASIPYAVYKDSYLEGNVTKWFVATQFEPVYARRSIPLLDEPSYKAIFNLDITVPIGYKAVSNALLLYMDLDVGTFTYYFNPTPKMSSYLLAFFVSTFDEVSSTLSDNTTEFKIFARNEYINYTTTAAYWGPIILNTLGGWLNVPYNTFGLGKSYQIAVPHKGGAMENWGLVTYAEQDILDSGDGTSVEQEQTILSIMCHELSHQWFGDYVTADWWSEIWLNEGLATYFQYFLAGEISTDSGLEKTFVTKSLQPALVTDSDPDSSPVVSEETKIYKAADINKKFDTISYNKGGAIFTFLAYYLGEENLSNNLNSYLQQWNLSNANTESFLNIVGANATVNVSTYLHDWLYSAGYPVVNVSVSQNGTKVSYTQERYFAAGTSATSDTQWYVPISYTTQKEGNFAMNQNLQWLEPNKTLTTDYTDDDGWLVVNLQQLGFYRVNYDETLWNKLSTALKQNASQIHVVNRAQILDDVFTLAKSNHVDYSLALDLATFLKNDTDYHSWYAGAKHLTSLFGVGDEEDDANLQLYIESLLANNLVIPTENNTASTPLGVLSQALWFQTACRAQNAECVNYAKKEFEKFKNGSQLDPNFKQTIICTAVANSNNSQEDYNFLFNLLSSAQSQYERNTLGLALTCVMDQTVIEEYLEDIINGTSIANPEGQTILTYLLNNNVNGPNVSLDFIVNKTSEIVKHFNGTSQLQTFITTLGSKLYTDDQIAKLAQYKNATTDSDLSDTIQKAIDEANVYKNWLSTHKTALKTALSAYNDNDKSAAGVTVNFMLVTILAYIIVKLF